MMLSTAAPVTRRSGKGGDTVMHDEAFANKVCKIYDLYLKERGWRARTGNKLTTWIFIYQTDKVRGEKGIHYAEDYNELGMMIEKYGLNHAPVNPKFRYVALLEKDRKTVTQIHDEVVAAATDTRKEVGNASLISNDNKAKKPKTKPKNSPSLTTAAVMAANGRKNHTRNNRGVLKNGLPDDPSSNKKVAHPNDYDSRSGVVMDKRKVDNDGLQKSSNAVTKKLKKNSPPLVTAPITPAMAACSRVSMSPSLLAKLDAVLVDPSLPGEVGTPLPTWPELTTLPMQPLVSLPLRNADTNETKVNSSVTDREVRVSIIMEKGSKSSNIMSGFDKISRETSNGLEPLDELKMKSAVFENFGTIGKVNTSLGVMYAKLAEFKAVGEQVELALREAGDELFGKEQMSICTTKVKSEF